MKEWNVALDAQLDLIRGWRSQLGSQLGDHCLQALRTSETDDDNGSIIGDWTGADLAGTEAEKLDRAETYFITRDMTIYAQDKAQMMMPQPLKDVDLPTPSGFAFFDQEISFQSPAGFVLPVKAVLWRPSVITINAWPHGERVLGTALSFYCRRETYIRMNQAAGTPLSRQVENMLPKYVLINTHGWPYDNDWLGRPLADQGERSDSFDTIIQARRFMAAFWALVQQEIVVWHERQPVDRHAAARATRAGFLGAVDKIRVITLRRRYHRTKDESTGDGNHREYSHRFLRRGHWRNQFFPKAGYHRQIWIDETIVGDENLPYIEKDRVFVLKR